MHSISALRHLVTPQNFGARPDVGSSSALAFRLVAITSVVILAACGTPESGTSNLEFVDSERIDPLGDGSIIVGGRDVVPPSEVSVPDAAGPLPDGLEDDGGAADAGDRPLEDTVEDVTTPPGDVEDVALPLPDGTDASVEDTGGPLDDAPVVADVIGSDVQGPEPDVEVPDTVAPPEDVEEDTGTEPDVPEPECLTHEDCPVADLACQVAACEAGLCLMVNEPVGTGCEADPAGADPACVKGACDAEGACVASVVQGAPCDDGDQCTTGEVCDDAGACSGGGPVICPTFGGCETSVCDSNQGCLPFALPDGLLCDDGDPCTFSTTCVGGACGGGDNLCSCLVDDDCYEDGDLCNGTPECVDLATGGKGCQTAPETPVTCPAPDDPCLKAVCVPSDGSCVTEVLAGATCDDGDPCTQSDTCDDDAACAGVPIVCEDGIPCTDDLCEDGFCAFPSLDGAPCDDGVPCTVTDTCADAACAGVPKVCDDGDPCTIDACDVETGACTFTFEEGATCDDASECTTEDVCAQGVCVGAVISCDDENLCTDDACDAATGCIHSDNQIPCPDDDVCTGPDVCLDGACNSGPIDCDDGLPCTADSCDPTKGCVHVPDDALCDDANPCTTDECQLLSGCVSVPNTVACDDGLHCTYDDTCAGGVCNGQPVLCNDGVDCTVDACDPETGSCTYVADEAICDDDNLCTLTSCDLDIGCVTLDDDGAECDDGVACTDEDLCLEGACVPGTNICPCEVDADCNDADQCNGVYICELLDNDLTACALLAKPVLCPSLADSPCQANVCQAASGECAIVDVDDGTPCADTDACTTDELCLSGECTLAAVDCDDAVDCTLDSCEPLIGCVHTPSAEACEDAVECTVDSCLLLEGCLHTPDNGPCDDGVGCTVDVCSEDTGCEHLEDTGPCDDAVACTLDICDLETGCYSVPDDALCEDGSPCTADTCDSEGCSAEHLDGPCEDGNLCTQDDLCVEGACQTGTPLDCDDGDPCTKDGCDPSDGECSTKPQEDGTSCEDDSACTQPDACEEGVCVSGPEATCDDAIDCTLDTCDPTTGCQYEGDDAGCDDANPCTTDLCVVGQGCVHEPVTDFTACDDGVTGTSPDVCVSGLCRGTQTAGITVATLFLCDVVGARLARVSDLDGVTYALMTYELEGFLCGTVQCPDSDGLCHSRVLKLEGATSQVVANVGGLLTGIGHDAVVGATGQVGQLSFGGSTVLWSWSALANAISDAGLAGGSWSDVWGASYGDDLASYTLVGRVSAGGSGRIVQCHLGDDGDGCSNAKTELGELGWGALHPVAVDGLVEIDEEPMAAVVAQALEPDAQSGLWLTEDAEEFDLYPLGFDLTLHDVTRPTNESAWLVGSDSLVAEFGADGWTTWPMLSGDATLELRAVTTVGSTLVAVGHDAADDMGAWLVALDLEGDASDATSWRVVHLGSARRVHDVHASDDGLTIVGASIEADGTTRPFLWHLAL